MKTSTLLVLFVCNFSLLFSGTVELVAQKPSTDIDSRPNILWLTAEDIGPHLGCYGDTVANTPNLDALAERGLTYDLAWSNYPVCAPARTTIITGIYASSHAAGHMRCSVPLDDDLKMFPEYLRDAGYYCTNKSKEDYNLENTETVWDQSDGKAHYSNRQHKSQPFFAVVNQTCTHESKIRAQPHQLVTDPATIKVPPYHPDLPVVRRDWAQYYDNIHKLDTWIGQQLQQLEESGQADNTIVVFYGDHGSGMPRHKRYAGDSGMRVPMIVYVPEKLQSLAPKEFQAGGRTNRPVGFVDLAPTMLSLAGIEPPDEMQGNAFMGKYQTRSPDYVFGFRSRMDERIDCSRSLSDGRYVYIRNYMPHLPHGQFIGYQQQTKTTAVWNQMYKDGKLSEVQAYFWGPKDFEELYDLENDPYETMNLAKRRDEELSSETVALLSKYRGVMDQQQIKFDVEMVPEPITARFTSDNSAVDLTSGLPLTIPFARKAADPKRRSDELLKELIEVAAANDGSIDSMAMQHWASVGILIRGQAMFANHHDSIDSLLHNSMATVRINAAETLATYGNEEDLRKALVVLVEAADMTQSDFFSAIWALNAITRLGDRAESIMDQVAKLPQTPAGKKRGEDYVKRLILNLKR